MTWTRQQRAKERGRTGVRVHTLPPVYDYPVSEEFIESLRAEGIPESFLRTIRPDLPTAAEMYDRSPWHQHGSD